MTDCHRSTMAAAAVGLVRRRDSRYTIGAGYMPGRGVETRPSRFPTPPGRSRAISGGWGVGRGTPFVVDENPTTSSDGISGADGPSLPPPSLPLSTSSRNERGRSRRRRDEMLFAVVRRCGTKTAGVGPSWAHDNSTINYCRIIGESSLSFCRTTFNSFSSERLSGTR